MRHFELRFPGLLRTLLILFGLLGAGPLPARADWELLPKNSHQLYETYGLFIDNQTTIAYYGASRAWGSLGINASLFGNPESLAHPQLVAIASVNANMLFSDSGRILTDSFDVRAGGAFEFALDPAYRLSLGAIHHSGHLAEGGVDRELLDPNLGDNLLFARFVYDLGFYARAGVTFMPVIHSGPPMKFFGANEFVEIFPLGGSDDRQKPSPYLALGLEQSGTEQYGMTNTFHGQVGVYLGNHFSNEHVQTARLVLGYYTGADPRMKYFVYRDSHISFGYLGLMANL